MYPIVVELCEYNIPLAVVMGWPISGWWPGTPSETLEDHTSGLLVVFRFRYYAMRYCGSHRGVIVFAGDVLGLVLV